MTFTTAELEEAFETLGLDDDGETLEDFDGEGGWETVAWEWDDSKPHELTVNDEVVKVNVLETSSGTYDDDTYIVVDVNGQTYIKYGYTASHDGTYYDGSFHKTEPEQKTITVWRRVRE